MHLETSPALLTVPEAAEMVAEPTLLSVPALRDLGVAPTAVTPQEIPAFDETVMTATFATVGPRIERIGFTGVVSEPLVRPAADNRGMQARAEALLEDISLDWQAPNARDISFFIASGDEALSWSFSEASPNHGAVAYQEDRVEIGEAAAGVALSLEGAQVALAHVQTQDVSFWGQRQEEDYSGVILTMKF